MEKVIEFAQRLSQNPLLNLFSLVVGIVGLMLGLIFYIRGKKEKQPCFQVRTFRLIEDTLNQIEAVQILYQGQNIKNLSLSKVALWNRGRDTINRDDVAPTDPLRLVVKKDYQLLAAEILYTQKKANNFHISPDLNSGEVLIDFDYFHTDEGLIMQIYHTGKSNDDICFLGTIKGVESIVRVSPDSMPLTDPVYLSFQALDQDIRRIRPTWLQVIPLCITMIVLLFYRVLVFLPDTLSRSIRRIPRQFSLDDPQ